MTTQNDFPTIIIPTCKTEYEIAPLMCNVEGFSQGCTIIATCKKESAAANRNIGLNFAAANNAKIIIMIDDDIAGFYPGWWKDMIEPLSDPTVVMVSARLMDGNGNPGAMMFAGDITAEKTTVVPRVPTACIAFRASDLRFNEDFKGSGFEDDAFCAELFKRFSDGKVVINNKCRMVHVNEMKNQGGHYFEKNKKLFDSLYRTSNSGTIRTDNFWNIPRILHFVWMGDPLPEWAKANIAEFKRLNPEFLIKIHDESAFNPIFQKQWDRINHKEHALAMKSDLVRLSVLMADGGWYFDTDFWPLLSIKEMCDVFVDCFRKTILFSSPDKNICANGVIACNPDDPGLQMIVDSVLRQTNPNPEWWGYGTGRTYEAVNKFPEFFHLQPLSKVIPITGKKGALACMRSREEILKVKNSGAWAIHFEMTTTTDVGPVLCTMEPAITTPKQTETEKPSCITANSAKTNTSTKKSSRAKKVVPSLSVVPSME